MTSEWSWSADDDAPKEALETMQAMFDPLRLQILDDAVRAIDYGWAGFEKIFSMRKGLFCLDYLKPMLHELTSILITDGGEYAGLTNNGEELSAGKGFIFTYDGESGNLYGRGRVRNLMDVMPWWNEANEVRRTIRPQSRRRLFGLPLSARHFHRRQRGGSRKRGDRSEDVGCDRGWEPHRSLQRVRRRDDGIQRHA